MSEVAEAAVVGDIGVSVKEDARARRAARCREKRVSLAESPRGGPRPGLAFRRGVPILRLVIGGGGREALDILA